MLTPWLKPPLDSIAHGLIQGFAQESKFVGAPHEWGSRSQRALTDRPRHLDEWVCGHGLGLSLQHERRGLALLVTEGLERTQQRYN